MTTLKKTLRRVMAVGVALGCVIAGALGSARATEIPYKDRDSGTFVKSALDSDGDGSPGTTGLGDGKSTRGRTTHHFFSETSPVPDDRGNCEAGFVEFPVVRARSVRRFPTGDLLVTEIFPAAGIGSGFVCADFATGNFTSTVTVEWTGGTGKFTNATGPATATLTGTVLVFDPAGGPGYGIFESSIEGTIILPDDKDDDD